MPHIGPHVLAGVNGSGKSTILRTIAWVIDRGHRGFQYDEWSQAMLGHKRSRALVTLKPPGLPPYVWACSKGIGQDVTDALLEWVRSTLASQGFDNNTLSTFYQSNTEAPRIELANKMVTFGTSFLLAEGSEKRISPNTTWVRFPETLISEDGKDESGRYFFNYAAYSPSKSLRHLSDPDLTNALADGTSKCLAFEDSVQNAAIQGWLLSLYSKRAIAHERQQSSDQYSRSLGRFEAALRLIYDQNVSFDVEIEPRFQPRLRMMGKNLNFSQLPDGVRSTVAWVADFMMRQDSIHWARELAGRRPGFLLLDEVDAHLHPFWQRRLLPAMRNALPEVQIIATSHSPFVISSCPESRVHVLELDEQGFARPRAPITSPIGESVLTTLKEIFGVESRFDILTEQQLNEWNLLKRKESRGILSKTERQTLAKLTVTLGERSEELRSIVSSPLSIPKAILDSLLGDKPATPPAQLTQKRKVEKLHG